MSSLLVFNRVYRLGTITPLTFSLVHLPHPSPLPKVKVQYIQGWRVLGCVGDHILQEFNTLFLTRFRTFKIALSPQTKT